MNKKVIEIPSNNIIPAGRSLGIEPNLLSGLSGFPERAGTCAVEKEWEEVLPILLSPGKVSMLMKGDRENAVSLTSLSIVDGKILAYSGESGGNTYIQATDPLQLREELMASIGENSPAKDIVLPMRLDALFVLAAFSDFIKRQKAQIMLGIKNAVNPPTESDLQSILNEATEMMDPRWWLTSSLITIYSSNRKFNVSEALKELQRLDLTDENEGSIYPTAAGFKIMDELTCRRGIVGFHSYYFEGGRPVQSTQVLLGALDTIWLIECGENSVLYSLSAEAAQKMIEQALTPGEVVPKGYGFKSPTPSAGTKEPATAEGTDTWLCGCGKENNSEFCVSCGKAKGAPVPPGSKLFCIHCGSKLKQDARFCMKCGKRV